MIISELALKVFASAAFQPSVLHFEMPQEGASAMSQCREFGHFPKAIYVICQVDIHGVNDSDSAPS